MVPSLSALSACSSVPPREPASFHGHLSAGEVAPRLATKIADLRAKHRSPKPKAPKEQEWTRFGEEIDYARSAHAIDADFAEFLDSCRPGVEAALNSMMFVNPEEFLEPANLRSAYSIDDDSGVFLLRFREGPDTYAFYPAVPPISSPGPSSVRPNRRVRSMSKRSYYLTGIPNGLKAWNAGRRTEREQPARSSPQCSS